MFNVGDRIEVKRTKRVGRWSGYATYVEQDISYTTKEEIADVFDSIESDKKYFFIKDKAEIVSEAMIVK